MVGCGNVVVGWYVMGARYEVGGGYVVDGVYVVGDGYVVCVVGGGL